MNSFPTNRLLVFQVFVYMLAVSGCSILPSSIMGNSSKIQTDQQTEFDTDTELTDNSTELAAELKDFQALKPSLTRLVALESDLKFLLEEVSRYSDSNPVVYTESYRTPASELSTPPLGNQIVYKSDGTMQSSSDESQSSSDNPRYDTSNLEADLLLLEKDLGSAKPTPSSLGGNKFSSGPTVSRSVEVASARPIMTIPTSRNNKFEEEPGTNAIVGNIQNVMQSKFSSQNSGNTQLPDYTTCANQRASTSSNFALHLASYKNLNNAKSGWQQLRQKYASTWCEASAKLETVNVKGTDYYSLRVGGYESKEAANQMCGKVRAKGDYCQVASFSGVKI